MGISTCSPYHPGFGQNFTTSSRSLRNEHWTRRVGADLAVERWSVSRCSFSGAGTPIDGGRNVTTWYSRPEASKREAAWEQGDRGSQRHRSQEENTARAGTTNEHKRRTSHKWTRASLNPFCFFFLFFLPSAVTDLAICRYHLCKSLMVPVKGLFLKKRTSS